MNTRREIDALFAGELPPERLPALWARLREDAEAAAWYRRRLRLERALAVGAAGPEALDETGASALEERRLFDGVLARSALLDAAGAEGTAGAATAAPEAAAWRRARATWAAVFGGLAAAAALTLAVFVSPSGDDGGPAVAIRGEADEAARRGPIERTAQATVRVGCAPVGAPLPADELALRRCGAATRVRVEVHAPGEGTLHGAAVLVDAAGGHHTLGPAGGSSAGADARVLNVEGAESLVATLPPGMATVYVVLAPQALDDAWLEAAARGEAVPPPARVLWRRLDVVGPPASPAAAPR